jgi:hypothetical protein
VSLSGSFDQNTPVSLASQETAEKILIIMRLRMTSNINEDMKLLALPNHWHTHTLFTLPAARNGYARSPDAYPYGLVFGSSQAFDFPFLSD